MVDVPPDCMIGPSDPCKGFSAAYAEIVWLRAELGDAKQTVIDLIGGNAQFARENERLHAEVRAAKLLREGLSTLANKASDYFEALERLSRPPGSGCGCSPPCRCMTQEALALELAERCDFARAALAGAEIVTMSEHSGGSANREGGEAPAGADRDLALAQQGIAERQQDLYNRAAQPASVGHPVCQSCGAFVDSRGKCRISEHNA